MAIQFWRFRQDWTLVADDVRVTDSAFGYLGVGLSGDPQQWIPQRHFHAQKRM
jgi:hypothetical protein